MRCGQELLVLSLALLAGLEATLLTPACSRGYGDPLTIPDLPRALKSSRTDYGITELWTYRADKESPATLRSAPVPKVVISTQSGRWLALLETDLGNPLFTSSYSVLANNYLLDSISDQTFETNDRELRERGIKIYSLSGKEFHFRKTPSGTITINGIETLNHEKLSDGTLIFVIDEFLFNNKEKIGQAVTQYSTTSLNPNEATRQVGHGSSSLEIGLPEIPRSMVNAEEPSTLFSLWEHRLKTEQSIGRPRSSSELRLVVVSTMSAWGDIIPTGADNPLFEDDYAEAANQYLLDRFSDQSFDLNDPKLRQNGVEIDTLSGKRLTFKKTLPGSFSVNGIKVTKHKRLTDGTLVFTIDDFLFDNGEKISNTFGIDTRFQGTEDFQSDGTTLPGIPSSVRTSAPVQFLAIWESRRQNLPSVLESPVLAEPKTVVVVRQSQMNSLFPPEKNNPLTTSKYNFLADLFIMDHISAELLDFQDSRLSSPQGLTIQTMSGGSMVFKKDARTGEFSVNDITVDSHKMLNDGTLLITVNDFLFDYYRILSPFTHAASIETATPISNGITQTFELPTGTHVSSGVSQKLNVPSVPQRWLTDAKKFALSPMLDVWSNLYQQTITRSGSQAPLAPAPKMLVIVETTKLSALLPKDHERNPLYSPTYSTLAKDFLMDSLISESINEFDREISSHRGLTVPSLSGKPLIFKKSSAGLFTLNGIVIDRFERLSDETVVVVLKDFLFDHSSRIEQATREFAPTKGSPLIVPEVPTPLRLAAPTPDQFIAIWDSRRLSLPVALRSRDYTEPKTVIVVRQSKMNSLFPPGKANPLTTSKYSFLADQFIMDHISTQKPDMGDSRLRNGSPQGITIPSMSGRPLVFKRDSKSDKLSVNDIPVDRVQTLNDGTLLVTISDFLSDYYTEISQLTQTGSMKTGSPISSAVNVAYEVSTGIQPSRGDTHASYIVTPKKNQELHVQHPGIERQKFWIPSVPQSWLTSAKKYELSLMLDLWSSMYQNSIIRSESEAPILAAPKTLVVVEASKLSPLIPEVQDPNALYSLAHSNLVQDFVMDSLILESINEFDREISSPEGLTVNSLSEKQLVFKKSHSGSFTLNGIVIDRFERLSDGTVIVVLKDFLFNHFALLRRANQDIFPVMPSSLGQLVSPEFKTVWTHVANWVGASQTNSATRVKTVIEVDEDSDAAKSYSNVLTGTSNEKIARQFLMDSVTDNQIHLDDKRLNSVSGLVVKTYSGKEWVFRKNSRTGKLTINGLEVIKQEHTPGGYSYFTVNNFLYNHLDLLRSVSPLEVEESEYLPSIPGSISGSRLSSLATFKIWKELLTKQPLATTRASRTSPRTVIVYDKLSSYVTKDSSLIRTQINGLTDKFMMDLISTDSLEPSDPILRTFSGKTLKTISNLDLVIKINSLTGKLSVNGQTVAKYEQLPNDLTLLFLDHYLFDHENLVTETFESTPRDHDPSVIREAISGYLPPAFNGHLL